MGQDTLILRKMPKTARDAGSRFVPFSKGSSRRKLLQKAEPLKSPLKKYPPLFLIQFKKGQGFLQEGGLLLTGKPLDLTIGGAGFFLLKSEHGSLLTRHGAFQIRFDGFISDSQGRVLRPGIQVPQETKTLIVNRYGDVFSRSFKNQRNYLGTLELGVVAHPSGLMKVERNLYRPTSLSGPLLRDNPGQSDFGFLVQGGLEVSTDDFIFTPESSVVKRRAFALRTGLLHGGGTFLSSKEYLEQQNALNLGGEGLNLSLQDLSRTQAERLILLLQGNLTSDSPSHPFKASVSAYLRSRRMNAEGIDLSYRDARRFLPLRMNVRAGKNPRDSSDFPDDSNPHVLEHTLRIARRKAAARRKGVA